MYTFRSALGAIAFSAAIASSSVGAVTRSWPGVAPCNGTLQACIDVSAATDTVQIATNTPITQSLFLPRSITLEGATGFSAQMASGLSIEGNSTDDNPYIVTVRRIALTNARIILSHNRAGTANIEIRRVSIVSTGAANAAGIRVQAGSGGPATVRVTDNRLRVAAPSLFDAALEVSFAGNNGTALIDFNHVEGVGDGSGWGILAQVNGAGAPTMTVINNEVRGRFGRAAVGISEGLLSSVAGTLTARVIGNAAIGRARQGMGIVHTINNGSINTRTFNNTAVGLNYGMRFSRWSSSAGTGSVSGPVENNLLAYNSQGLSIRTEFQTPVVENVNLLFANDFNAYTPGALDVTLDPKLRSLTDVRLRDTSPAINAGDSGVSAAYTAAGVGLVDTDGLRRVKLNRVDIGAYEYGDFSALARADAPSGNTFVVNDSQINMRPRLFLFATARATSETNAWPIGVYYSTPNWRIFNQNIFVPMPVGMEFSLFVPVETDGTFLHTVTAANRSGHFTTIDHMRLNNLSNKIVLATSNWNPDGVPGVYNNHNTSVGYLAPSWFVLNNDFGDMSIGASFNIYSQDPSPNAYVHTVNNLNSFAAITFLDHPLLNVTPCAQVNLTPRTGLHGDTAFVVGYAAGAQRWGIANANDVAMTIGAEFNVVIDAAQVAACAGVLFADGFED